MGTFFRLVQMVTSMLLLVGVPVEGAGPHPGQPQAPGWLLQ